MTTLTPIKKATSRVLLIEDDAADAHLIRRGLRETGWHLSHETTLCDGLSRARDEEFDAALLDLTLPDQRGMEIVQSFVDAHPDIPVVVCTGHDDERLANQAIRHGAQDYIVKNDMTPRMLVRSVQRAQERHAILQELEATRRLESELKDKFLSHVSHELRTPLTAILQFVTILQDGIAGPLNDEQVEYLGIVRRNGDQLRRMIATLMDVTRAESSKLTMNMVRIDLRDAIQTALPALIADARTKDIEVSWSPPRQACHIVGDQHRLVEVLCNLVENAIKFTPNGGRIDVSVERDASSGHWCTTVSDSGRGIPPEEVALVFDRLRQTGTPADASRNGLGLGLHISREIVRLHDGEIWAESELGKGSKFHFKIPQYQLGTYVARVANSSTTPPEAISAVLIKLCGDSQAAMARGMAPAVQEVEELVTQSILASRDVRVPTSTTAGHCQFVLALAHTTADGANAIAERIREQLAKSTQLARWKFRTEVETKTMHWAPGKPPHDVAEQDRITQLVAKYIEHRGGTA